jgi:hypothetical protein
MREMPAAMKIKTVKPIRIIIVNRCPDSELRGNVDMMQNMPVDHPMTDPIINIACLSRVFRSPKTTKSHMKLTIWEKHVVITRQSAFKRLI